MRDQGARGEDLLTTLRGDVAALIRPAKSRSLPDRDRSLLDRDEAHLLQQQKVKNLDWIEQNLQPPGGAKEKYLKAFERFLRYHGKEYAAPTTRALENNADEIALLLESGDLDMARQIIGGKSMTDLTWNNILSQLSET
jgi:hypothetical protein